MLLNCDVGEDSWESLGQQEIQPVHPKGDQSWVFIGRTDAESETPILWPPHAKSWLIGKDPDAGRDWGEEEKGMTEEEMAGWHHRWTWVWVNSGSWWCTGRPGVLRFMGSQRVGHDWVTELNWTRLVITFFSRTSVVRGILQARMLEWAAYPFSSGSSRLRNRTRVSCIAGKFFTNWEQLILFAYMIKDLTVATPSLDQPRVQGHQPWFAASCHAGPCPAK